MGVKTFIKYTRDWIDKRRIEEGEYYLKLQDKQTVIQEKRAQEQLFITEMRNY